MRAIRGSPDELLPRCFAPRFPGSASGRPSVGGRPRIVRRFHGAAAEHPAERPAGRTAALRWNRPCCIGDFVRRALRPTVSRSGDTRPIAPGIRPQYSAIRAGSFGSKPKSFKRITALPLSPTSTLSPPDPEIPYGSRPAFQASISSNTVCITRRASSSIASNCRVYPGWWPADIRHWKRYISPCGPQVSNT
jgi:hypothetical protein